MPSFFIPRRPNVTNASGPIEVAEACNALLEDTKAMALLDEKTIAALRTGRHRERIDAIYAVNYILLDVARNAAMESLMSKHIPQDLQDALAFVKPEPGIDRDRKNSLLEALRAVRNLELDVESVERRASSNGSSHGPTTRVGKTQKDKERRRPAAAAA